MDNNACPRSNFQEPSVRFQAASDPDVYRVQLDRPNDCQKQQDTYRGGGNSDQDDELTIPRAAMNKMIKELLPNVRVANEARELVLNCCTEFIHLLSSESNDVCNQQQKKTISAEHVLLALEKLDFGEYVGASEEVLVECKETAAKRRRQSTRLENLGIPEEELLRQQQELFAKAREAQQLEEQQQQLQMQQQLSTPPITLGLMGPPPPAFPAPSTSRQPSSAHHGL